MDIIVQFSVETEKNVYFSAYGTIYELQKEKKNEKSEHLPSLSPHI